MVRTRYPTLPLFTFEECFDYGRYAESPPEHRHFVPRYSKLKKAGGKSITFYEKWRRMQVRTLSADMLESILLSLV